MTYPTSCFRLLGIPEDVSDDIVRYAYTQQNLTDPTISSAPKYLTALQEIAHERNSDLLLTEVALQRSAGRFDLEQLRDAYDFFRLQADAALDDEYIIGNFYSRLQDAPVHEKEMREHLRIIGAYRQSPKISAAAEDSEHALDDRVYSALANLATALSTYEQALTFLGCNATTSDDFIPTMYTSKVRQRYPTMTAFL